MLHCTNCGTELPANAMLCPKCGTAVGASLPLTEARAIQIFIGDKNDYFTGKWAAMSAAGKQTSWNWPEDGAVGFRTRSLERDRVRLTSTSGVNHPLNQRLRP